MPVPNSEKTKLWWRNIYKYYTITGQPLFFPYNFRTITKKNMANAWKSNNMAINETQQPAATTMVIRNIKA
jgi:hypothetical protein